MRLRLNILVAGLAVMAVALLAAGNAGAGATAPTQPTQPEFGPGGSNYSHGGVRVSSGGEGPDAWYVFEPTGPRPEKAPLAVVMHGYYEYSGYASMSALIEHTVRKGSVVIYPRWQTDIATPCPGPYLIDPCLDSAVNGIEGALDFLRSDPKRVQPELGKTSYLGFSFGGIITADLANRWRELDLPKPRAVFLEDPHDGGLAGFGEPALDDSLAGIPSSTLLECHSSADGVISESGKEKSGCNAVYPKLTSIPARNKDLVMISPDAHGSPPLGAGHGVCAGGGGFAVDAYDWGFCWKVWDALRSCALSGKQCGYALGDSRRHRYTGTWSDGVPMVGLKVARRAPILTSPPPPRTPAPR